jgi:hypothetical protein
MFLKRISEGNNASLWTQLTKHPKIKKDKASLSARLHYASTKKWGGLINNCVGHATGYGNVKHDFNEE